MRSIKDIRLKDYDYSSNGYYFVTIVCDKRKNFLASKNTLIREQLNLLESETPGLKVDYFVTMPNHIHAILILKNSKYLLGQIVRKFKARISYQLKQKVWQPNYYEHVIRNEQALEKIREYIIYNPELEVLKFNKFYN